MTIIGNYLFGTVLGKGKYGWVSQAKHLETGTKVAIKHYPWQAGGLCGGGKAHNGCSHVKDSAWQKALNHEASILSQISHPSIVSLIDLYKGPLGFTYICLEDLGTQSLMKLVMESNNLKLPERKSLAILKQSASGLKYLHDLNILHRDIKPENIMIVRNSFNISNVLVKIIDLGLAIKFCPSSPPNTSEHRAGTLAYMAPELMKADKTYGNEIDIFSLGASFYFSLIGESPFREFERNGVRSTTAIFGIQAHHEDAFDEISSEISKLVKSMIDFNPAQRISLKLLIL